MLLTWNDFIYGSLGGLLIGVASLILWLALGRITGISGITAGLITRDLLKQMWRLFFILGLVGGGFVFNRLFEVTTYSWTNNLLFYSVAGLLVGLGASIGSGCTSGHGVCGLARFSKRSFVAVTIFMITAMLAVTIIRITI